MSDRAASGPDPPASPYVGLAAYTEEQANLFFGREAESETVINNLRASRLTLLYGQSGVGKSSLLQAGVAARLWKQAAHDAASRGAARFIPAIFSTWSADPVPRLVAAVESAVASLRHAEPSAGAHETLRMALVTAAQTTGATVLVILDQFEEYFVYRSHDAAVDTFADALAECVTTGDLRANFLISIREDAYAALGNMFRSRIANVYGNFLRLEHLTRNGGREAIQRPVEVYNRRYGATVVVESELTEAVLDDLTESDTQTWPTGAGSESAPRVDTTYLQVVMRRLWDEETSAGATSLRLDTLQRLGGARAIIASHVDRAMEQLPAGEQDAAASALRFLVTRAGTKIALSVDDLGELTGLPEDLLDTTLQRLSAGNVRILRRIAQDDRRSSVSYEISHDALGRPILEWRTAYRRRKEQADRERLAAELAHARRQAADAQRRLWRLRAGALILALAAALATVLSGALDSVENSTVDARFAIRGTRRALADMTVVDIDQRTLNDLGVAYPLPRSLNAQVIDRLHRAGARLIVYDIDFTGKTTPTQDLPLLEALARARPVVLAATATNSLGETGLFGGEPGLLQQVGARPASPLVPDVGVVRKVPYSGGALPSIAVSAADLASGEHFTSSQLGGHSAWVDYAGPPGTIRTLSFLRVLRGDFPSDAVRGKIVVVGVSLVSAHDLHDTSIGGGLMSGAEIQANAIDTVRRRAPLRSFGIGWAVTLTVMSALLAPLLAMRVSARTAVGVGFALLGVYLIVCQLAFDHGTILPVSGPALAFLVTAFALLLFTSTSARPRESPS